MCSKAEYQHAFLLLLVGLVGHVGWSVEGVVLVEVWILV
jgi:hypothetical protein